MHARELQKQEESKDELGEGLNIKGRSDKREKKGKNSRGWIKIQDQEVQVFYLSQGRVRQEGLLGYETKHSQEDHDFGWI